MRAVASVCPYITTKSKPRSRPSRAKRRARSGSSRPPAWVMYRSVGRSRSAKPAASSMSNVYGTPANDVAPASANSRQNPSSTTDRSVSRSEAPATRWLFTTESP